MRESVWKITVWPSQIPSSMTISAGTLGKGQPRGKNGGGGLTSGPLLALALALSALVCLVRALTIATLVIERRRV